MTDDRIRLAKIGHSCQRSSNPDMGNVSHALPTIHPVLDVGTRCAGHAIEMTAASVTPAADRCLLDAATAMAATVIDYWTQPDLRQRVAQE